MDSRTRAWIRAMRHEIERLGDAIAGYENLTNEETKELVDSFDPQARKKVI